MNYGNAVAARHPALGPNYKGGRANALMLDGHAENLPYEDL